MNFWKIRGRDYDSITQLGNEDLKSFAQTMSRSDIIEWLSWNDRNGIYDDKQSLQELGNIISRQEGITIMLRQIEEGRPHNSTF